MPTSAVYDRPAMQQETFREQLARVKQMARNSGPLWDLSPADEEALRAVLASRSALLTALIAITSAYSALLFEGGRLPDDLCRAADDAITAQERAS